MANKSTPCVNQDLFRDFCEQSYPSEGWTTSLTVRLSTGEKIISYLKGTGEQLPTQTFRIWVKRRGFQVLQFPALGLHYVLCTASKDTSASESGGYYGPWRRVAFVEDFYSILLKEHTLKHGGYKNLLNRVTQDYSCLPRSAVQKFVNLCTTCRLQKTRAPLKPIIAEGFNGRCQVDLIDMRSSPDGDFHWIGHYMDHWSKFHILFPLVRNSAADVANALETMVFPYIGPPRILQSDNGREFVNDIVQKCLQSWNVNGDPTSHIVNGRACHPQSQGLVERFSSTIKRMLRKRAREEGQEEADMPWSSWLGRIMFDMNCQASTITTKTPYRLVFGRNPVGAVVPGHSSDQILLEEDVEDMIDTPNPSEASNVPSTSSGRTLPEAKNRPVHFPPASTSAISAHPGVTSTEPHISSDSEVMAPKRRRQDKSNGIVKKKKKRNHRQGSAPQSKKSVRIQFGWMHREKATKSHAAMRAWKGGGTRYISVSGDTSYSDLQQTSMANQSTSCVNQDLFRDFCEQSYPSEGWTTSLTVRLSTGEKISSYLKGTGEQPTQTFRIWVKRRGFQVLQFPALGLHDVLCTASKDTSSSESGGYYGPWRRVAFVEDFYSILLKEHTLKHGGYKNLLNRVTQDYSCLPRSAVQKFVNLCTTCRL